MYNCYVINFNSMSRTKEIDFRRVTFSLPASTIDKLKMRVEKGQMSKYLSNLIEDEIELNSEKEESTEDFIESLRKFAIENKAKYKNKKSTLEMIREIRYHGKY